MVGIGTVTLPNGIVATAMSCEMEDGRIGYFCASDKSEKKIRGAAKLSSFAKEIKSIEVKYEEPGEYITDDGQVIKTGGEWTMMAWF